MEIMPRQTRKTQDILALLLETALKYESEKKELGISDFLYDYKINSTTVRINVELHNDLVDMYQTLWNVSIPKLELVEGEIKTILKLQKI